MCAQTLLELLCLSIKKRVEVDDFSIFDTLATDIFSSLPDYYLSPFVKADADDAVLAESKYLKYFDNDSGIHQGLQFLKIVAFFNPKLRLGMSRSAVSIPGMDISPMLHLTFTRRNPRISIWM